MKETVSVPIICAGRMDNPDMASEAIQDGTCDIISLGRPLLADPDYVNKLRADKSQLIRPCLSCQEGCMGRIQEFSALNCAVNPHACRERYTQLSPTCTPKKVLIIGGGVAGCEAARVLKLRGHQPVLCEKNGYLGGNIIPGGAPDFKEDDHALAAWYEATLEALGVDVRLNTVVDKQMALSGGFDAIMVASGSVPKVFSLGDDAHTFTAAQVLMEEVDVGKNVAVIGGGLVGCELAMWLQDKGIKTTIIEAMSKLLAVNGPLCHANSEMLELLVPYKGIDVKTNVTAKNYANGVLTLSNGETLAVDSVVLAVGYKEKNDLYAQLEDFTGNLHLIGDARRVANIMYAIWDAFEVASTL